MRESAGISSRDQTIAAVDLGSNSFHLAVARVSEGGIRYLERRREPVRLAAGLEGGRCLDGGAVRRALDCLGRFGRLLRGLPASNVRAVGTCALRQASDAANFIAEAGEVLGFPVSVISGHEEARLIYAGVVNGLADDQAKRLVVDIGGGSTEFILGRGPAPEVTESLQLGCVSLSQAFFPDRKATPLAMRDAREHAHRQLEMLGEEFRAPDRDSSLGASGTLRTLARLSAGKPGTGEGITRHGLIGLEKLLIEQERFEHFTRLGLSADRAEVLAAGLCICRAVVEVLGIERMQVAEGALREGLLVDIHRAMSGYQGR